MSALAAGLVGLTVCGAAGALVPSAIRLLPEPPADPEPGEGVEPTAAQRARREEPPKELYVDLGRRPRLALVAAAISGLAGALLGLGLGWDRLLCVGWPLVPVGTLLAIVDWRTRLLPAVVVLPATLLVLLYGAARWVATGDHDELLRGVVAMLAVRTFFWMLWFVRQAGMGFGDVRLAALLGLVLGYAGWGAVVVGVYSAFLLFAVPGLAIAVARRDPSLLRRAYPFGPFLLLGALLGLLAGQPVLDAVFG